jgi:hypothetical protein
MRSQWGSHFGSVNVTERAEASRLYFVMLDVGEQLYMFIDLTSVRITTRYFPANCRAEMTPVAWSAHAAECDSERAFLRVLRSPRTRLS